jgi:hypothetical protein
MSRWKASAIHLGISVLVISTLGALLAMTWYPPAYAWAMGGLGLIAILACVDVCLGPLLTLIVWDVKKPSLKLDMAVIVLIQMFGLGYGLYTIFMARPVYLVFAVDRFELVSAPDIPEGESEKAARAEFKSLPLANPRIVAAQMPIDSAERSSLLFSAMSRGRSGMYSHARHSGARIEPIHPGNPVAIASEPARVDGPNEGKPIAIRPRNDGLRG